MLAVIVQQTTAVHPSAFQEIADGVIIALLLGIGGWGARRFKRWDAAYDTLATRKPTELEPHPPKGLVDQVADAVKEASAATAATGENTNAVLAMGVRQGQANGTMKDIQAVQKTQGETQDQIVKGIANLQEMIENIVTTGSTVKLDLDTENERKATIAQESQTELLRAIGHGEVDA